VVQFEFRFRVSVGYFDFTRTLLTPTTRARQDPDAEANKDLPIGRCFALDTLPSFMPPSTNPEECLGRFLHKKSRLPQQRTISYLPIKTCLQGSQATSFRMCKNVMKTRLTPSTPNKCPEASKSTDTSSSQVIHPCFLRSRLHKRVS